MCQSVLTELSHWLTPKALSGGVAQVVRAVES